MGRGRAGQRGPWSWANRSFKPFCQYRALPTLQPQRKESLWLFPGAKTDSQTPGRISTVCIISVCREKVGVGGKRVNCLRAVQHLSQFCPLQAWSEPGKFLCRFWGLQGKMMSIFPSNSPPTSLGAKLCGSSSFSSLGRGRHEKAETVTFWSPSFSSCLLCLAGSRDLHGWTTGWDPGSSSWSAQPCASLGSI